MKKKKISEEFWFILKELNALYSNCFDSLIFDKTIDHPYTSLFKMIDLLSDSSFFEDSRQNESVLEVM